MKKALVIASAIALASCQSTNNGTASGPDKTLGGAALGAVAGAVGGLLVAKAKDKDGKDKRKSILIGAGIGALVGGGVGAYMDRQEAELRQQLGNSGVTVSRVGDQIILNLPGNVTFASDSAELNPNFFGVLNEVAIVLQKYQQTLLDIDGHTDSTGDDAYNQALSERRAVSVGQYINQRGVDARRLLIVGYGETRPVADNATDFGRQQNRRVEIRISPLRS